MGFRNFRFSICCRAVLLTGLCLLTVWSVVATGWIVTPTICAVLVICSVIELVHYVDTTNRRLVSFLDFISHQDYSSKWVGKTTSQPFDGLDSAYQLLTSEFRRLNAEKEANHQYLDAVVEHLNVALLCLDAEDNVILMNHQAKLLFDSPYLHNLDALEKLNPDLPILVKGLKNGQHQLVNMTLAKESLQLAVYATNFQLLENDYKVISFQNIRDELEQHEIDSWHKLIRVLTHEIINSITPITALTQVIKQRLAPQDKENSAIDSLTAEEIVDLQRSISSIESRSKGLQEFVQTYQRLTTIPSPNIETIEVSVLIDSVSRLISPELEKRAIHLRYTNDGSLLRVNVDPRQIEQILINLINNAIESLSNTKDPEICIHARLANPDRVEIQVADNGSGIAHEYLDQVFVPFFTTKQDGSGIGLSISRQMAIQNQAILSVDSETERGCIFTLKLRSVLA